MTFFCFRFFKIRANCFSENFYKTLYTDREHLKKDRLNKRKYANNLFNDVLTKKRHLQDVDKLFIKTQFFQKNVITFINIYEAKVQIRNDVGREHVFIQIFYTFSKVFQIVIVKLS